MERGWRATRDAAVEKHDAALARYPTRQEPQFTTELSAVVAALEAAVAGAREAHADAVEISKTLRWLGDALYDLARGKDAALLLRGVQAYDASEQLLATEDAPLESAKLSSNYGNTLRGLAQAEDAPLLEVVEARYRAALTGFNAPGAKPFADMVRENLSTLEPQLALARGYRKLARLLESLCALEVDLAAADATSRGEFEERLDGLKAEGRKVIASLLGALDEATAAMTAAVRKHAQRFGDGGAGLRALLVQASVLKTLLEGARAEDRGNGGALEVALLGLLEQRLEQEASSGTLPAARAAQLREILNRGRRAFGRPARGLDDLLAVAQASRELVDQSAALMKLEVGAALRDDPRARRALVILSAIFAGLCRDKTRSLPEGEATASSDLLQRVVAIGARARQCTTPADLDGLERDVWGLARNWHDHVTRYHLIVANPIFQTAGRRADEKSVFVSGGEVLRALAPRVAADAGLHLLDDTQSDLPEQRWNQLWNATVAVFDLGVPLGAALAQVCYELGLALAAGKPCVVLTRVGGLLPFDVALPTAALREDDDDVQVVQDALTRALAEPAWGGAEAGLRERFAKGSDWIEHNLARPPEGTLAVALRLARKQQQDATAFGQALERVQGELGADAPVLLRSAWPPRYPDPRETPRCFHVMPFRPSWANSVRDLARRCCEQADWRYTRGDEAAEQRIVRGIWDEIATASAVLVDVTGHNPNVALELGLTHALGRPYRLVAQGDHRDHLFPAIAKLQIHAYAEQSGHKGLQEAISELLKTSQQRKQR